jgi:Glycosyl hydrolases family 18
MIAGRARRPSTRRGRGFAPVWVRSSVLVLCGWLAATLFVCASSAASATTPPGTVEAWIYPSSLGQPACDVPGELAALSSDPVALLKAEYLDVAGSGRIRTETAAQLPCNGYSPANLAEVRSAAGHVYVTVSSGSRPTKSLLSNPTKASLALSTIETFVASNDMDGVDLDFEPNRWTTTTWSAYTTFIRSLVEALAPAGRAVEVDLEPFTATPYDAERYADVASAGAHVVVMAYDHEFDLACAPISPYSWLEQVVAYAQSQVAASDLTIGLPSYGYTTPTCRKVAHVSSNVAYVTMERQPGFPTTPAAVTSLRDPSSGEIRWESGGVFHDVVDATALDAKLQTVEEMGVADVSVWSLGGEPWFTGNPS